MAQIEDFFCSELVAFSYHFATEQAKVLQQYNQIPQAEQIPGANSVFSLTDQSLNPNTMFYYLQNNRLLFNEVGSIPQGNKRQFV
jgi:hypothetical protein